MTRTHWVSLLALAVAVPAATASAVLSTSTAAKPCFIAGNSGYQVATSGTADTVVRIDNSASHPSLRLQLVDDAAAADFVLVDDGESLAACQAMTAIKRVRLDPAAAEPDLTVALSRDTADLKIFVRSANFSEQDAAALFAAIWQGSSIGARKVARHTASAELARP